MKLFIASKSFLPPHIRHLLQGYMEEWLGPAPTPSPERKAKSKSRAFTIIQECRDAENEAKRWERRVLLLSSKVETEKKKKMEPASARDAKCGKGVDRKKELVKQRAKVKTEKLRLRENISKAKLQLLRDKKYMREEEMFEQAERQKERMAMKEQTQQDKLAVTTRVKTAKKATADKIASRKLQVTSHAKWRREQELHHTLRTTFLNTQKAATAKYQAEHLQHTLSTFSRTPSPQPSPVKRVVTLKSPTP
eukprot:TRINITY_DN17239_c0_g1_i1.p1 TRINITY_DN17239_c0_g1~~TRINITY_DN17239_c0_g1_i1.p1  ORF type:complete len:250 (+),score=81.30 TRINITY_DN17239_c0_g1_i1:534-1283(+)